MKTSIASTKGVASMDLEQAKKRNHKIMINEIAIDKVTLVKVKGLSFEDCKLLWHEHKELLRVAMEYNNSNEVLSVLNLDNKLGVKVLGSESNVKPLANPDVYSMFLAAFPYSLAFLHNHPSTNVFSLSDIATFIQFKEIGLMSVVTNQGDVHILKKDKDFDFKRSLELAKEAYFLYEKKKLSHNNAVKWFLKNCYNGGICYAGSK